MGGGGDTKEVNSFFYTFTLDSLLTIFRAVDLQFFADPDPAFKNLLKLLYKEFFMVDKI